MQSKLKVIAIMLAAAGLASHAAQAQEKVVIGYISDLSGLYADLEGKGGQVAIQMAIDDMGGKVLGQPVQIGICQHSCPLFQAAFGIFSVVGFSRSRSGLSHT